jgi:hemoglobin-like flavoprotein
VLSLEQPYLLRRSFSKVERQSHVAALVFYQQLFSLDPSLRPLFKNDIESQAAKLMDMLAAALSLLEKPDELVTVLEELGARHVEYGVQTAHYDTVGAALIGMLQSVLGKEFTAETRQAWIDLYQIIATTMLRGAARVSS